MLQHEAATDLLHAEKREHGDHVSVGEGAVVGRHGGVEGGGHLGGHHLVAGLVVATRQQHAQPEQQIGLVQGGVQNFEEADLLLQVLVVGLAEIDVVHRQSGVARRGPAPGELDGVPIREQQVGEQNRVGLGCREDLGLSQGVGAGDVVALTAQHRAEPLAARLIGLDQEDPGRLCRRVHLKLSPLYSRSVAG